MTERSPKTIERWTSDAAEHERYRPTRSEALLLAYLTGYRVSRYTGDELDDVLFPIDSTVPDIHERLAVPEVS